MNNIYSHLLDLLNHNENMMSRNKKKILLMGKNTEKAGVACRVLPFAKNDAP